MVRAAVLMGLVLIELLRSTGAAAQPQRSTAEALFQAGREAAAAGDHATACQRFRESQRLDPAPGTILNLAMCEEALGQLAAAWQHYQEGVQQLPADDDRRPIGIERLTKLEPRIPKLVIELEGASSGSVTVIIDSVELAKGSFGVPVPVDPGQHRVVVRAPGTHPREFRVSLAEGERQTLRVKPGEPLPPPAPKSAPKDEGSVVREKPDAAAPRWPGWVLIGVGTAGLAATGALSAAIIDKKRTVNRGCDDSSPRKCNREGFAATKDIRRFSKAATASFVVGAATAGAGVAWVVWRRPGAEAAFGVRPESRGATLSFHGRY